MGRNYAKILTETEADKIVDDFVLHFSILLFSNFSKNSIIHFQLTI